MQILQMGFVVAVSCFVPPLPQLSALRAGAPAGWVRHNKAGSNAHETPTVGTTSMLKRQKSQQFSLLPQVQLARPDLHQPGARPGGASHLVVLLRPRSLVLCGEEAGLPRPPAPQPQLAEKGE